MLDVEFDKMMILAVLVGRKIMAVGLSESNEFFRAVLRRRLACVLRD